MGPFGLRVEQPHAHLSTTRDGGFTLYFLIAERLAGSCEYYFYSLWLDPIGIESECTVSVADQTLYPLDH